MVTFIVVTWLLWQVIDFYSSYVSFSCLISYIANSNNYYYLLLQIITYFVKILLCFHLIKLYHYYSSFSAVKQTYSAVAPLVVQLRHLLCSCATCCVVTPLAVQLRHLLCSCATCCAVAPLGPAISGPEMDPKPCATSITCATNGSSHQPVIADDITKSGAHLRGS